VRAIHGNCDVPPLSELLPPWRLEQLVGRRILVLHDLGKPERPRPAAQSLLSAARPSIVISGHSHQGRIAVHGEVLYVNPGSAGPKRFKLVRSAARLTLGPQGVEARLFSLESTPPRVLARTRFGKRATVAAPER
jgi:predicted phosphodiesterase